MAPGATFHSQRINLFVHLFSLCSLLLATLRHDSAASAARHGPMKAHAEPR